MRMCALVTAWLLGSALAGDVTNLPGDETNLSGDVTNLSGDVTNLPTPVLVSSLPTTVTVFENATTLLPCYVQQTEMPSRVRWWKEAELLGDTYAPHHLLPGRHRMWPNNSLQITHLEPADSGNYTCEVVRPEPFSPTKQTHRIDVQYAPVVRPVPDSGFVEVRVGEQVDIGCNVTSHPPYTLVWTKNGEVLQLRDQRNRIRFKAESRSLAGIYECTASNGVGGPVRASIRLQIMDAPVVMAMRTWVHTVPGVRAVLEADLVFADPPAVTTWYRDGVQVLADDRIVMIVRDHKHQLIVRNVRESDLGNYTFRAENRLGMADVSFRLTGVPNAANFKLDPAKNKVSPTTFTLVWEVDSYSIIIEYNLWVRPYEAHSEGSYVVTEDTAHNRWRRIVVPGSHDGEGPIHSMSYELKSLTPGNVYEAFVVSRNRFGWSKPSSIVRFPSVAGVWSPPPQIEESTPHLEDMMEDQQTVSIDTDAKDNSARSLQVAIGSPICVLLATLLLS